MTKHEVNMEVLGYIQELSHVLQTRDFMRILCVAVLPIDNLDGLSAVDYISHLYNETNEETLYRIRRNIENMINYGDKPKEESLANGGFDGTRDL